MLRLKNYYLAIDQGTHASRAILYDDKGTLVTSETQSISLFQHDNGHIEQDPEDILRSVQNVTNVLLKQLPEKVLTRIISCGIACQRSTILACNVQGTPLTPAISWQDTRGAEFLKDLKLDPATVQNITGLPVSAHYSASKIHWLLTNSETLVNTPAEEIYFTPLVSYLLFNLSEDQCFTVDHSHAQRTQLFNIHKLEWSQTLIDAFGINREKLPKVNPMFADYGLLRNTRIPIRAVCGDQNAAALSIQTHDGNSALINLGSGAFILHTHPHVTTHGKLLTTIAYSSKTEHRYCREATVNGCGNALEWFHRYLKKHPAISADSTFLKSNEVWHRQIASWLKDNNQTQHQAIVFINSVGSLGSPWWSNEVEPHFHYQKSHPENQLNADNIAAHARAVFESIAFLLQDNLRIMQKEHPIRYLKIGGGLSQLDILCQTIANLSHIPVERIIDKESTARGIAWLASGKQHSWQTVTNKRFDPELDSALEKRHIIFTNELTRLLNTKK